MKSTRLSNILAALRENLTVSVIVFAGWIMAFIAINLFGMGSETIASLSPLFCPFRKATGIPCPGCGMTRAFLALAELAPLKALRLHPLSLPFLLAIALSALGVRIPLGEKTRDHLLRFTLALLLIWWFSTRLLPALRETVSVAV